MTTDGTDGHGWGWWSPFSSTPDREVRNEPPRQSRNQIMATKRHEDAQKTDRYCGFSCLLVAIRFVSATGKIVRKREGLGRDVNGTPRRSSRSGTASRSEPLRFLLSFWPIPGSRRTGISPQRTPRPRRSELFHLSVPSVVRSSGRSSCGRRQERRDRNVVNRSKNDPRMSMNVTNGIHPSVFEDSCRFVDHVFFALRRRQRWLASTMYPGHSGAPQRQGFAAQGRKRKP